MAEPAGVDRGIQSLIAARNSLKSSLEKSKAIGLSLGKPVLALVAVGGHINRAVGPAAAVLKVLDAVHGLEKSLLSDPKNDLSGYLSVLKRLEEALRFLGENCGLAIQWLEDIVEYLEDHSVADEKQAGERVQEAVEGQQRPTSNAPPLGEQACIAPQLPVTVIHKLQAILGRLRANNRLDKCISVYVEVRSSNVRASLQALDLDYLDISVTEFNGVQSIEEFKLCNDVFERFGSNVWMDCFSKIAAQAGMLAFLQFGKTVTDSKKDPIKLLKLDLIKKLIDGAAEIFWELLVQVEIQKQIPPPNDGGVPRLVSFVTDYCNKLIGDKYKSTLTQVLLIHKSWRSERFQDNQLMVEVLRIIKMIEQNMDAWMKAYPDQTLAHFFGMNNHWHLYKNLKGTRIGDKLGDSWLKEHDQYKEYYATVFLRDSWGKLPSHLSREGLILFSGGHATARDLVKKRLKSFNDALDEMYKKQSAWVIPEKDLRDRVCQQIVQAVVPVYRSYMQNYGPLVEKDASSSKYVRYTVVALEKMLSSLYIPKPMRYGSFKGTPPSEKLKSEVDLRRTTSAVV
ncbi:hypothetical protein Bca52824_094331 [Brassica carinata]|uniref:Exocyst subunit Exo70 family protein n=1 Tax=Brassica carinata TaxID=52824 RepID=A0A8X7TKV2_BRACI|nr:hypothetical protein Bca52824_094331 [Brassica carinata]